jgi:hypothetical protein
MFGSIEPSSNGSEIGMAKQHIPILHRISKPAMFFIIKMGASL